MRKYSGSIVIKFDTDATGNAGSDKPVTVYVTGTITKANLFEDDGITLKSNPVIADSDGNYSFTVTDGTYDLVIDEGLPTESKITKVQIFDSERPAVNARIVTTVAEITAGNFSVGDKLSIEDRANACFNVEAGGTANGMDILDAGNGNTAVFCPNTRINVQWFGALPSVNDVSDNIQRVIDYLDTSATPINGGVVYFPRGDYLVNKTITISSTGLPSISLEGEGELNTRIRAVTGFVGSSMIHFDSCTYCSIKDMNLLGANLVNRGLFIDDGNQNRVERVNAEQFLISPFYVTRSFMLTMSQCRSRGGSYGFDFSGGYNTSLNIENCYANNTNVGGSGFYLFDVGYSTFNACGSDNLTGWHGYRIENCAGVQFTGCGTEGALRAGWRIVASAALDAASEIINGCRVTLDECFAFNCSGDGDFGSIGTSQVDTSVVRVVVNGFYEHSVIGAVSVSNDNASLNHSVRLNNCHFTKSLVSARYSTIDSLDGAIQNSRSVTGSQSIFDVSSAYRGGTGQYSGLVHVMASNIQIGSGSIGNIAGYVLLITKGAGSNSGNTVELVSQNGLVTGGGASHPSFTWTFNTGSNQLIATPIGSTSGTFYFLAKPLGGLRVVPSP